MQDAACACSRPKVCAAQRGQWLFPAPTNQVSRYPTSYYRAAYAVASVLHNSAKHYHSTLCLLDFRTSMPSAVPASVIDPHCICLVSPAEMCIPAAGTRSETNSWEEAVPAVFPVEALCQECQLASSHPAPPGSAVNRAVHESKYPGRKILSGNAQVKRRPPSCESQQDLGFARPRHPAAGCRRPAHRVRWYFADLGTSTPPGSFPPGRTTEKFLAAIR